MACIWVSQQILAITKDDLMRFRKMGVPPNYSKLDKFSIEIYGFGDPPVYETSICA